MPICKVCFGFFVKAQTFDTLFQKQLHCTICDTYLKQNATLDVFPLHNAVVECYAYDADEHPALTKQFFETMTLKENQNYYFFEPSWQTQPISLILLTTLIKPLRIMSYQPINRDFFEFIDQLKEKILE